MERANDEIFIYVNSLHITLYKNRTRLYTSVFFLLLKTVLKRISTAFHTENKNNKIVMKIIWKGHCKGYRRIRLFASIYIKTYQDEDGKTWNSASSGKRTKVGRMTRYSETPQHKWRFRINMTLRNKFLHFEFSYKTGKYSQTKSLIWNALRCR